jgi:hypothetical protein
MISLGGGTTLFLLFSFVSIVGKYFATIFINGGDWILAKSQSETANLFRHAGIPGKEYL